MANDQAGYPQFSQPGVITGPNLRGLLKQSGASTVVPASDMPGIANGVPFDPYWSNVVYLAHMDGDEGSGIIRDYSSYADTKSVATGPQTEFIGSTKGAMSGQGLKIVKTSNRGIVIVHPRFRRGTNTAMTIEFRYKLVIGTNGGLWGTSPLILRLADNGGTTQTQFRQSGTGHLMAITINFGDSSYAYTPDANGWVSVALVTVNGSNTGTVYFNGVASVSGNISGNAGGNGIFYLGGLTGDGSGGDVEDWIDEVRVTMGVARYTANYTPATQPFPDRGPP